MPHDWKRTDQQADVDFLRGASHMAAALCQPGIDPMTAGQWANYLRGRAAAGKPIPPLMWFLGHVGLDRTPEEVYVKWLATEDNDAE